MLNAFTDVVTDCWERSVSFYPLRLPNMVTLDLSKAVLIEGQAYQFVYQTHCESLR